MTKENTVTANNASQLAPFRRPESPPPLQLRPKKQHQKTPTKPPRAPDANLLPTTSAQDSEDNAICSSSTCSGFIELPQCGALVRLVPWYRQRDLNKNSNTKNKNDNSEGKKRTGAEEGKGTDEENDEEDNDAIDALLMAEELIEMELRLEGRDVTCGMGLATDTVVAGFMNPYVYGGREQHGE
ncbi:hypothetical protein BKA81DRAFT_411205 [Phyllosticta paracitricarpa]